MEETTTKADEKERTRTNLTAGNLINNVRSKNISAGV